MNSSAKIRDLKISQNGWSWRIDHRPINSPKSQVERTLQKEKKSPMVKWHVRSATNKWVLTITDHVTKPKALEARTKSNPPADPIIYFSTGWTIWNREEQPSTRFNEYTWTLRRSWAHVPRTNTKHESRSHCWRTGPTSYHSVLNPAKRRC
jgi:hypothetical protein